MIRVKHILSSANLHIDLILSLYEVSLKKLKNIGTCPEYWVKKKKINVNSNIQKKLYQNIVLSPSR